MPTWKRAGYEIVWYAGDHPPVHVHIFRDGQLLDRYDLEHGVFMDGTIGRHMGRVLKALGSTPLLGGRHHGRKR